jgi:hypothetical protein
MKYGIAKQFIAYYAITGSAMAYYNGIIRE